MTHPEIHFPRHTDVCDKHLSSKGETLQTIRPENKSETIGLFHTMTLPIITGQTG